MIIKRLKMRTENTEYSIEDVSLDYEWIASQIKEAIEHLQEILTMAENHKLEETLFTTLLWSSMTHLNSSYNLRHMDAKAKADFDKALKFPKELSKLINTEDN